MKDYFFFELRQLLKSKKTIGLFCLLLIYSGVYSFWQRDFRPIERVLINKQPIPLTIGRHSWQSKCLPHGMKQKNNGSTR